MSKTTNNRFQKIIGSLGMSAGLVNLIVPLALMKAEPLFLISSMIGGTFFLWPITYVVSNKLLKRSEAKDQKELRCISKTFAICRELEEKDKTYCQTTTNFFDKISQKEIEVGMKCGSNLCTNINSLLYLINANYFDEIAVYLKNIKREELIDMLLEQIFIYLQDKRLENLKNRDLEVILKNCYFLKTNLKERIRKEFQESEVNFNGFIDHSIINKKIDVINEKEYKASHQADIPKTTIFDVNNIECYKIIVEGIIELDDYLCNFGNVSLIEWDYEALEKVVCFVAKEFRKELIKQIDNYTEYDLAASLTHNAMAYAVLNKKKMVSYQELLNTFKEWNYIAYDLRCEIVEQLINRLDLSKTEYPLNIKKTSYSKRKVIDFNQYKQGK